ncbi:MAG: hypothetical protein RL681_566 [Candidatus Parcubacteria bacterium]|jgi:hypothetical protein
MTRKIKIFLALVVIVAGGYIAGSRLGLSSSNGATDDFKDARAQGAVMAQDIVNLSNGLQADLERVNKLESEQNYAEALTTTVELLKRTQDVKAKALELSKQLERMTGALAKIDSPLARQAALESISNRLALIGRLLSYSDYLSQLFTSLNLRFSGQAIQPNQIKNIIAQVNAEVTAVNNFNREASQAMDRFDAIVEQGK